ncbi:uncharacterized protein [Palaemon carinicauda]|uniref:uncharacterized protein n=1 Tax=Palaemon carinicauda TaxID=392227 RepID=UPI0035B5BECF
MEGVTVLLAGDFQEILAAILRSPIVDELNACLKASLLWSSVQTLPLTTNMRVQFSGDSSAGLGNGIAPVDPETGLIQFPRNFCTLVKFADDLMDAVFSSILQNYYKPNWIRERAILALKKASVTNLNIHVLRMLPGNEKREIS